ATVRPIENKTIKVETIKKPVVKPQRVGFGSLDRTQLTKGNSQNHIDDKDYWDSGCSRHMTGNISYLFDYEPFDRGYVSFGQGRCKITGKGTIKTGRDFKLIDDTNVLLRTLRQHNMYSIDLNNNVPHKDLTCLVAKASADECILWHRRLGHLNIKTMNRVLVNKSQNKTPYELFNSRTPAIGFLKTFGCHVMIFNTLDNLRKFEAKGDEDFLENKAIEKGAGPNWLFVIDYLTNSMNYVPVVGAADAPESSGNLNPTASTINPQADPMDTLALETLIPNVSSPVPTACLNDSPELSSDTRLISKRVTSQDDTPSLDHILTLTNMFEDIYGVTTNTNDTHGEEADIGNMETTITASPTLTLRIHMDHPKSQIIGPVDTPVNTRTKGTINQTLFIKRQRGDFILVQVHVDDIIFGSSNPHLCREFKALMHEKFQMSAMGELNFFLGLQVLQKEDGIFLSQDKIETTEEGTKILATIDGMLRTVSESSIRRNIKLNDEAGISSLPDAELFENPTLIGYNISPNQKFTFQKGQFSCQWKYLIHTIMQCLSLKIMGSTSLVEIFPLLLMAQFGQITQTDTYVVPFHTRKMFTTLRVNNPSFSGRTVPLFDSMMVSQGEDSGTPTEPHHTPSYEAQQTSPTTHSSPSLLPVTTELLPTVIPSDKPPLRQYTRRARIAQTLALPPVANEPASPIKDVSQGEACPTDSGLEVDQDRANIPKTSTLPSDSTPRVTSLATDEGTQELEINSLKPKIKLLEDKDGRVAEQSRDDALIKRRRLDEGEEVAERVSDDTEEMETVLTSMDATSILTSGGVQVVPTAVKVTTATVSIPTSSGVVSTASLTIPTTAPIFTTATDSTPYTRRKGKEKMVESDTPKKKMLQEQIDVQIMIDGLNRNNETVVKYLQEYHQFATELPIGRRIELISDLVKYQDNYANAKHFKGMTLEEIKEKFDPVWKQIQEFIPIGSKEESERLKRKGIRYRNIHASGKGLPPQEGSGDSYDMLQTSSGELLSDGK
nr:putative ribonuclease H-like domain-containing protein [Tanacetum cinerariifolium]